MQISHQLKRPSKTKVLTSPRASRSSWGQCNPRPCCSSSTQAFSLTRQIFKHFYSVHCTFSLAVMPMTLASSDDAAHFDRNEWDLTKSTRHGVPLLGTREVVDQKWSERLTGQLIGARSGTIDSIGDSRWLIHYFVNRRCNVYKKCLPLTIVKCSSRIWSERSEFVSRMHRTVCFLCHAGFVWQKLLSWATFQPKC